MAKYYKDLEEMVGRTPILELSRLAKKYKLKARLFGKCEMYNPLFSVKDRVAKQMIDDYEKKHEATKDTIFMEATSGNTGIALAAICASKGYKLVIVMPENMSEMRKKLLQHLGTELILTPSEEGMVGAIKKANFLASKNENVVMLKQFENPANVTAHQFGTSIEILDDMGGEIDAFVAGVGTAGTLVGVASALRTYNPDLKVIAVEPKGSPVLRGEEAGPHKIQGIGAGFVPPFYNKDLVNEIIDVADEDAIGMAAEAAKVEGLPVGISAGAALAAAIELGQRPEMAKKNIVAILPDSIERYLSEEKKWFSKI